jgi:PTH2 family peptidyl-tRNA hydrolase
MYILVNTSLKMSAGKKCAQVGHAVQAVVEKLQIINKDLLKRYNRGGQAKIVLKATEEQMKQLIDEYPMRAHYVLDAGHTQVEPGSLTAMAFYPMTDDLKPKVLTELKLL